MKSGDAHCNPKKGKRNELLELHDGTMPEVERRRRELPLYCRKKTKEGTIVISLKLFFFKLDCLKLTAVRDNRFSADIRFLPSDF